ncbi:MAG: ferritin-like domain-containing protein [Bacillota bacterium]|nr:ferritin-like domain-containing protein [Bacillota bacterium]
MLVCSICGMIINEKNMRLNKEAFINNEILHCPFCGAGKEYISENAKPIIEETKAGSETERKIIDNAMKLEIFNGDFYTTASQMAKDEDIKKLFKSLSSIEYTHANVHRKILGEIKLPEITKIDYSKYDTDEKLKMQANIREKHAVAYYKKYTEKIDNINIVKILKALSKVETEHIYLTK